jgi:hypothetical protein
LLKELHEIEKAEKSVDQMSPEQLFKAMLPISGTPRKSKPGDRIEFPTGRTYKVGPRGNLIRLQEEES